MLTFEFCRIGHANAAIATGWRQQHPITRRFYTATYAATSFRLLKGRRRWPGALGSDRNPFGWPPAMGATTTPCPRRTCPGHPRLSALKRDSDETRMAAIGRRHVLESNPKNGRFGRASWIAR